MFILDDGGKSIENRKIAAVFIGGTWFTLPREERVFIEAFLECSPKDWVVIRCPGRWNILTQIDRIDAVKMDMDED